MVLCVLKRKKASESFAGSILQDQIKSERSKVTWPRCVSIGCLRNQMVWSIKSNNCKFNKKINLVEAYLWAFSTLFAITLTPHRLEIPCTWEIKGIRCIKQNSLLCTMFSINNDYFATLILLINIFVTGFEKKNVWLHSWRLLQRHLLF